MNELVYRVNSPSPKFFKRLRWITGFIGTAALAVGKAFDLPPGWEVAMEVVGYTASGSWITSFFPTK